VSANSLGLAWRNGSTSCRVICVDAFLAESMRAYGCQCGVSAPDGRAIEHEVNELMEKLVWHIAPLDEHPVHDRPGDRKKHE
jgi:hypothetical protein